METQEIKRKDETERKQIIELLYGMTTVDNAIQKQRAWARKLGTDIEYVSPSGIRFMLIPAGTFMMGSNNGHINEKPVHPVIITKPFYLGKHPLTQQEWKKVLGDVSFIGGAETWPGRSVQYKWKKIIGPSSGEVISLVSQIEERSWWKRKKKLAGSSFQWSDLSFFKGHDLPVENVSWDDCQKFIQNLNAIEGTDKYRLPTESEWEYACRAGSVGKFCFGDDKYLLGRYAWFDENSGNMTHPVGQLKPNAWNLHEMHGNVWEWCQDWYGHDYYRILSQKNLTGPYRGSGRVVRGGSWVNSAFYCRSACRSIRDPASLYNFDPGYRSGALGFRLLRSP